MAEQFAGIQLERVTRTTAVVLDSDTNEGIAGFELRVGGRAVGRADVVGECALALPSRRAGGRSPTAAAAAAGKSPYART